MCNVSGSANKNHNNNKTPDSFSILKQLSDYCQSWTELSFLSNICVDRLAVCGESLSCHWPSLLKEKLRNTDSVKFEAGVCVPLLH